MLSFNSYGEWTKTSEDDDGDAYYIDISKILQPLWLVGYNQVKVVVKGVKDMMFGGDGGNWTPVRKPSNKKSTCLV